MQLSIKKKVILFIVVSLILVLGAISYINYQSQKTSLENMYNSNAATIQFALSKNIETIMRSGENEEIQPLIELFLEKELVQEISIINAEKIIARTTNNNLLNKLSSDLEWTKVFNTGKELRVNKEINNIPMLITYKPYLNVGSCTECHDEDSENNLGGLKIVKSEQSMIDSINASSRNIILLGLFGALLIIGGMILFLNKNIFRPISELQEKMTKAASGEVDQIIEVKSDDEIGKLLQSIKQLIEYIKELSRVSQDITKGNLLVSIEPKSEKDVLGHSFKTMIFNLNEIVRKIADNTFQLASETAKITTAAEQSSVGTRKQNTHFNEIESAVEMMNATITESTMNTSDATELAKSASGFATDGKQIVEQTIEGMHKIAKSVQESSNNISSLATSAEQIGEIINVIDDIADQTNLLALNAAIEAARAGEQGRGFAVVADEVRKLAERTGKATGEISGMINEIQDKTSTTVKVMKVGIEEVNQGTSLADKAGESLTKIEDITNQVMLKIEQVSSASNGHAKLVEDIGKSAELIANLSKTNLVAVDNSVYSAELLNEQAGTMKEIVKQFEIKGGGLSMFKIAQNDHAFDMSKLKNIIDGRHDANTWVFTTNHECAFGKWYYGNGQKKYTELDKFKDVEAPHYDVHTYANQAVQAYNNSDFKKANDLYKKAELASHIVISSCDSAYNEAVTLSV